MRPEYKNWVPKGMIYGLGLASGLLGAGSVFSKLIFSRNKAMGDVVSTLSCLGAIGAGAATAWCAYAHDQFSYEGDRKLSKEIVEGIAQYADLPENGIGLDVGCGSGALTIAVAKRNPKASMIGIDRWGAEYASFSRKLCEDNARAEGIDNAIFRKGDACHLSFEDETFDCVVSNYVYHNISGYDRQNLLRETLRVLKKGGTFAIHDLMERSRYGDMDKFCEELRKEGYEDVRLIPTAKGKFMTRKEGLTMFLYGSALLTGKK